MGAFARDVQKHLLYRLSTEYSRFHWSLEHDVAGTPVDVVGMDGETLVCIELEWRRADPADNTAKLFRHLSEKSVPKTSTRTTIYQIFSHYYDLTSGGVSSKRLNAEFVGEVASDAIQNMSYHPIEFALEPPKRGAVRPEGWRDTADETVSEIVGLL